MRVNKAEEIGHYWKTSQSSPDSWLEKTARLVERHGGQPEGYGSAIDIANASGAYRFLFSIDGRHYNINWPILPTKTPSESRSSMRQAATMLYHHVKALLLASKVLGPEIAFAQWLMLPDGRTLAQYMALGEEPIALLMNGMEPYATEFHE